MSRKCFGIGVTVALFTSTAAFEAQACGVHFGFSLPFISFGIGLGLGAPCIWPDCGYAYPHPAYAYTHPAYASTQPANYMPSVAEASPAPVMAQTPTWVPATPGAGHWVPDPEPYSSRPVADAAKKAPASVPVPTESRMAAIRSPGGVPVYIVTQSSKPES